jgi:hypothetical protein
MNNKEAPQTASQADLKEYVRSRMQGERLDIEAIRNRLSSVVCASITGGKKLKPYPSYREWIKQWEPKHADLLLQASDPSAISEYDGAVQQFNEDLERIKAENDSSAVNAFVERLLEISKNK